ncbi:MAG: decaprenyl-phosphate phosphoribosyltransferase [candidate division Zixibacteria bacterium]|nr:decaprenyl-phosphate phosphoribosyltransferase [candidate division Zixibacteria bacterium]
MTVWDVKRNINVTDLIRSMRPSQWVKNTVVFAGLIFSLHFTRVDDVLLTVAAFAIFCALASAVYLLNDIKDREMDREHPQKRNRPIASGRVPVTTATVASFVLFLVGLAASTLLGTYFLISVAIYVLLNVGYSYGLKHVPILDVMIVSAGFVIRAVAGAVVIGVAISPWLVVCTSLLALFLGFGKRRWELETLGDEAPKHRVALEGYTLHLTDQLIAVTTASTVVAYALYTLAYDTQEKFGTTQLIWTLPFVLYGVFRYLYLIHGEKKGGNPTRALMTDGPILIDVALWLITVIVILARF